MARLKSSIFMIGRSERGEIYTLKELNCATNSWSQTSYLNFLRKIIDSAIICAIKDVIFVLEGYDDDEDLYPETDVWSKHTNP